MTKQTLIALMTCGLLTAGGSFNATAEAAGEVAPTPAAAAPTEAAPDQAAPAAEATALDGSQLFVAKACLSCHGPDGRTPILPIYPKVAGQNADYLYNQMRDYKNGSRTNGQAAVMLGIMAGVNEGEMRALADWLGAQ